MSTKKKTSKKTKNKPDINIQVRNLSKVIRDDKKKRKNICGPGHHCNFWIFGSALAMILSYARSESILWAILHGVLSWFYIIFRAMQVWGWF